MSGFRINSTNRSRAPKQVEQTQAQRDQADLKQFQDLGAQLEKDATTVLMGNPFAGGHAKRQAETRIKSAKKRMNTNVERHWQLGQDLEKRGLLEPGATQAAVDGIIDGSERARFVKVNADREIDLDRVKGNEGASQFLSEQAKIDQDTLKAGDMDHDGVLSAGEAWDVAKQREGEIAGLKAVSPEAADVFEGEVAPKQAMNTLLGYDPVQKAGFVARAGHAVADTATDLQKGFEHKVDELQDHLGDDYFGKTLVDGSLGVVEGVTSGVAGTAWLAGKSASLIDDPASRAALGEGWETAKAVADIAMDDPKAFADAMGDEFKQMIDGPITAEGVGKAVGFVLSGGAPKLAAKAVKISARVAKNPALGARLARMTKGKVAAKLTPTTVAGTAAAGLAVSALPSQTDMSVKEMFDAVTGKAKEQETFRPWEIKGTRIK